MATTYDFLEANETIIMEGAANKQLGVGTVNLGINKGGKLVLTDMRLIFIAHSLNIGAKFEQIYLSDVVISGQGMHIGVPTPNLIRVTMSNGKTHLFVVEGKLKEQWEQKIAEYVSKSKSSNSVKTKQIVCENCGYTSDSPYKFCPECGEEYVEKKLLCPQCGKEVDEAMKFCIECGCKIEFEKSNICSQCGNELIADVKFCPECGNAVGS